MKADFKGGIKVCSKCKQEKRVEEYHVDSRQCDGRASQCKECINSHKLAYRLANKEKNILVDKSGVKICSKCKVEKPATEFSINRCMSDGLACYCKDCISVKSFDYGLKNQLRNPVNGNYKIGMKTCARCKMVKSRVEFSINRSKLDGTHNWCKSCVATYQGIYVSSRLRTDALFRLELNVRRLIRGSFKRRGFRKNSKTFMIIGCSPDELRAHLSYKLQRGWTIENHGKVWHIDHIIPLGTAKTEEDVIRLCHYTNLQPLSGPDNLRKGAKLSYGQ